MIRPANDSLSGRDLRRVPCILPYRTREPSDSSAPRQVVYPIFKERRAMSTTQTNPTKEAEVRPGFAVERAATFILN